MSTGRASSFVRAPGRGFCLVEFRKVIANHFLMIGTDNTFFENAPIGLACPSSFYQIENNQIQMIALTPAYRQG